MATPLWESSFWSSDLPRIAILLGIIIFGLVFSWLVKKVTREVLTQCCGKHRVVDLIANSTQILLLVFFVLVAFAAIEINVGEVIISLGVAAIVIAASLNTLIQDVGNGLCLIYSGTLEIGNRVIIGSGYQVPVIDGIVFRFGTRQLGIIVGEETRVLITYTAVYANGIYVIGPVPYDAAVFVRHFPLETPEIPIPNVSVGERAPFPVPGKLIDVSQSQSKAQAQQMQQMKRIASSNSKKRQPQFDINLV